MYFFFRFLYFLLLLIFQLNHDLNILLHDYLCIYFNEPQKEDEIFD